MSYVKTIVCFANSRKNFGRCTAGKEWINGKPGEWVRPISRRVTHEISEEEQKFENGYEPQLLDIIQVPCESRYPLNHQRENHIIASRYFWLKRGKLEFQDAHNWLDAPNTLWGTGQGSYTGLNNRVAIGAENGTSLHLISVKRLQLLVGLKAPEYPDSKRAVRGQFVYQGSAYRMDVTDPVIERKFMSQADGHYEIHHPLLCVSLGDPYKGYYYKLIAGVLYEERFR
ncbi:dual OB domain-containing protein [Nitrosococcus wardiae]|uniref:Dual OB-containing domain-containing protein n=1 Tax=Nitrosococcus wardiae TaxID=1814290 RepID=A0A4V1AVJ5_9GAMM|nr:hypothetical protein [Nitrosococcus wardiae]QBQ53355.1 hypothetical protein E3U44_01660 [Nitrosococcus wardiae]